MVLPESEVTMSPGRWARLPGMFSTAGTIPVTAIPGLSCAMACMAPMTAAPPAMSYFIFSMPSEGLMEMPPVSKVTPLPIRPRCAAEVGLLRPVLHHDERGWIGAALGDAEKRAHAELPHAILLENLAWRGRRIRPFCGHDRRGSAG